MVIYSSLSGNTKKLAEYISENIRQECSLADIKDNPEIDDVPWIIAGFWVDKGTADKEFLHFLSTLEHKKICLIGTLGAYPDSDHAKDVIKRMKEEVEKGNTYLGCYLCQGKISPKLTKTFENFPEGHPHFMDDARRKRHEEAAKHPDENDLLQGLAYCKDKLSGL
ncbi:MAG: flavodoxin family protein [Spirochaetales bacterium]|nr:flavodoxin family protein [Spirochaetales bacterium]